MKKLKHIFVIYQDDEMDCVSTDKQSALELAVDPRDDIDRSRFKVERWVLKNNKYQFEKRIQ
jgi:kynurenine formamidase